MQPNLIPAQSKPDRASYIFPVRLLGNEVRHMNGLVVRGNVSDDDDDDDNNNDNGTQTTSYPAMMITIYTQEEKGKRGMGEEKRWYDWSIGGCFGRFLKENGGGSLAGGRQREGNPIDWLNNGEAYISVLLMSTSLY